MRRGLFGGTFDPPHLAHLAVAESARSFAGLDRVVWIPVSEPPHVRELPVASGRQRLEMVRLAIETHEAFEVSDIELRRAGKSYTVETLREVNTRHPDDELFLVIGGDSLRSFHTWRQPHEILEMATLVVFDRDHDRYKEIESWVLESAISIPDTPLIDISSSNVRNRVAAGLSIRHLVPESVAEYIRMHELYQ